MDKNKVLLCDVGGTNVRFGVYTKGQKEEVVFTTYKCNQFSSFEEAAACFLKEKNQRPHFCVIGAAGDLDAEKTQVLTTNTPWKVNTLTFQKHFPFMGRPRLENDFDLQGWALNELKNHQYCALFHGTQIPVDKGQFIVIGPGTGLGTCLVIEEKNKGRMVRRSESGHASIPHVDFQDPTMNLIRNQVLNTIQQHYQKRGLSPIIEHLVSGTGISNIYHALTDGYIPEEKIKSEKIEQLAQQGDWKAMLTFKIFNAYLGAHTGSLVVANNIKNVFFCGGLMASPWVKAQLETGKDFQEQLHYRGLLSGAMNQVNFLASTYRDMATLGAIVRADRLLDFKKKKQAQVNSDSKMMKEIAVIGALLKNVKGQKAQKELNRVLKVWHQHQRAQTDLMDYFTKTTPQKN